MKQPAVCLKLNFTEKGAMLRSGQSIAEHRVNLKYKHCKRKTLMISHVFILCNDCIIPFDFVYSQKTDISSMEALL